MIIDLTFTNHNVALEVDSVALRELEHGEQFGLRSARPAVVLELRHDGPVRAAPLVHQLHRGVLVREAEASPHLHAEASVVVRYVSPAVIQLETDLLQL